MITLSYDLFSALPTLPGRSTDGNHRYVIKWISIGNELFQDVIDAIDDFEGRADGI